MPLPKAVYEEMIARHAEAARLASRIRFWAAVRTVAFCWCWALGGMVLLGLAFHTSNLILAHVAFWSGLTVGNGGVLFTLVAYWRAAASRGDYGGPPT